MFPPPAHALENSGNFELDLSRAFQNEVASFRILSRSAKPLINFFADFQIYSQNYCPIRRIVNQSENENLKTSLGPFFI